MRHTLLFQVLLLCCVSGSVAVAEHHCISEEIENKVGPRTTAVVLELPTRESGMMRAPTASDPDWAPIRFQVFTEDLNDPSKHCTAEGRICPDFTGGTLECKREDILTKEKRSIILNSLLPRAFGMHTDRLLVKPLTGRVIVPRYSSGICAQFKIPSSHHTEGVSGADMYLYVSAGPTQYSTLAWATTCSQLTDGRPVVGVVNYGPSSVTDSENSVRVSAHEVAHAIGFAVWLMKERNMLKEVLDVRGKAKVLQVSPPKTVEKTREHFNCMSATGMELEDEGGERTASSHWKRRNAKDELMAGIPGIGYYTALTMAAFEDTGFYMANWGKEEPMSWGNNSGCALLTEKCLINGVTQYPEMFCTAETGLFLCTSDRLALGYCTIHLYTAELPSQYQYFSNLKLGGALNTLMDFCPYIRPNIKTRCSNGDATVVRGSRVGPRSKCLKGDGLADFMGLVGDVCAEVSCEKGEVSVRYLGDDAWHKCPEGGSITPTGLFMQGRILCPKYDDVCTVIDACRGGGGVSSLLSAFSSIPLILLVLIFVSMCQ
ncbi:putative surface protease GP63 [Trypanosoma cruzi]|uniref:Leishmanolysin-like peptidase n=2 Tax=Trypanosoma cruzi TaxID=5693 RepID=Q4DYE3_TRYCC|nr:surface protease GP63, putative [Trypanosoma cruzi]EAN97548.1 surface protease GP63, putative [Trypanosoma cruzi]KAF8299517.1 putative surface protease GP63 [Trypanosoma cruzi]PWV15115.1 putative surface protease GP63 [Trypanosoma cruzi]|eukprot:XP_819399.1 surface protease GP63 [Trypanosoma cruzi strain CL Brener]